MWNVLFNDALNTFYLRLYGVGHMVKDHSDSKRGNPLLPHGLLFSISSKFFLYALSHRQNNTYHAFGYTSRGALAGTRNSSMGDNACMHTYTYTYIHTDVYTCTHKYVYIYISVCVLI